MPPSGASDPRGPAPQEYLGTLKAKVDAGADFVVSQLCFDASRMREFLGDCRRVGITCPVIPGIMPIQVRSACPARLPRRVPVTPAAPCWVDQTYASFERVASYCGTAVPEHVWEALRPIRSDDAAVKAYGVELAASLARNVLEAGAPGLHFYTLNLERSVTRILGAVGLVREPSRSLPWRPSAHAKRQSEDVRPIFWANRPESYLSRTASWDEFPNGRWGDARSPAYGEPEHHLLGDAMGRPEERRAIWGEALAGEQDVCEVFARYVTGQIPRLPWCATQLASETTVIQDTLARMNRHGFLTINSQPRVAGARSDDATFGWGGPGGLVYQKAYVEFFCSPETLRTLMHTTAEHPSIVYHASDANGNTYTNAKKKVGGVV